MVFCVALNLRLGNRWKQVLVVLQWSNGGILSCVDSIGFLIMDVCHLPWG